MVLARWSTIRAASRLTCGGDDIAGSITCERRHSLSNSACILVGDEDIDVECLFDSFEHEE